MKLDKTRMVTILSGTFTFLLTMTLIGLYICGGLGFGAFNNQAVLRKVNDSNYYDAVYQELTTSTEKLVTQAGFPAEVLTDVITLDRVYIAGRNYMEAVLGRDTFQIKTDKITDELTDNIYAYLVEEDIVLTEELDNGIDQLVEAVKSQYVNGIQLKFAEDLMQTRNNFLYTMRYIIPILIVIIGILCYFLIRIHIYAHRGVRYITYAVCSSSLLTILAAGYTLMRGAYTGLQIEPLYYKNFIEAYLQWDILVFLYIGGIGMTIAIALISLVSFLKNGIVIDND